MACASDVRPFERPASDALRNAQDPRLKQHRTAVGTCNSTACNQKASALPSTKQQNNKAD
eukprot:10948510-Alexandrium_andersonii.AAC.1